MSAEPSNAERSDRIWITRLDGPFEAGRRVAVKDLFDTAGVRTTYGSAVFADHVPETTAAAVERLEGAGWAVVGKANLHEFAYGITSHNQHWGDVPNPVFAGRVAGGSSGGSAAAVAAGAADLGLGTDSGGSIRIPAACCELAGFKPSFGAVPMDGCFPLAPSFDHAGPIARDVAGCAAVMEALAGAQPQDVGALSDLRIGYVWREHADAEVREVLDAALAAAAPHVRAPEPRLPLPDGVFDAFQAEVADVHRDLFAEHGARYGANVAAKVRRALALGEDDVRAARRRREGYREVLATAFEAHDLLIAPTLPVVPPLLDADELGVRERMTLLTFPLNVGGVPAIALPCGRTASGLPVSLQLFGPPGADALVLGAGALLESALRHTALPRDERDPKHPERGT